MLPLRQAVHQYADLSEIYPNSTSSVSHIHDPDHNHDHNHDHDHSRHEHYLSLSLSISFSFSRVYNLHSSLQPVLQPSSQNHEYQLILGNNGTGAFTTALVVDVIVDVAVQYENPNTKYYTSYNVQYYL